LDDNLFKAFLVVAIITTFAIIIVGLYHYLADAFRLYHLGDNCADVKDVEPDLADVESDLAHAAYEVTCVLRDPGTDLERLALAYTLAQLSEDPSTQNGAILLRDGDGVIGWGFNHLVEGSEPRWEDKTYKYAHVVHAETAAILNAATQGNATIGGRLFVCWGICLDCARDIVEAGIIEVVCHRHPAMLERPDWQPGIDRAMKLLKDAGVVVRMVEGDIGVTIRFNGKDIAI
jgi:deoxycytidylate deaminase